MEKVREDKQKEKKKEKEEEKEKKKEDKEKQERKKSEEKKEREESEVQVLLKKLVMQDFVLEIKTSIYLCRKRSFLKQKKQLLKLQHQESKERINTTTNLFRM